jgi:hypothetical protein
MYISKKVPIEFKANSTNVRRQVLAGLIDAIGRAVTVTCVHYEITLHDGALVDDVLYLARSLGYDTVVSNRRSVATGINFTTISIYGDDLHLLPVASLSKRFVPGETNSLGDESFRVEQVNDGSYFGFQITGNGRFLLGDFTVTHNTTFMENMAYYRKHLYPVGRVFIATEDGYKHFSEIFHPLYVSNYWDEKEEEKHVLRQRTCEMENGRGYPGNYAVNIIDDVGDDPKIYRTKLMRGLFKLGSQHWAQLLMVGTQYAIDFPPDIRLAVSYVALGRTPDEIERKKLYNNFGGLAGSYERFCDLMDQITGDHTFLIIKKRSQSNELEECVSWFKTKKLGRWKFGSKEYRKHAEERYDTKYVETIMM